MEKALLWEVGVPLRRKFFNGKRVRQLDMTISQEVSLQKASSFMTRKVYSRTIFLWEEGRSIMKTWFYLLLERLLGMDKFHYEKEALLQKGVLIRRIFLVEQEYKGCNPDWSKTMERVALWEGSSIIEKPSIMRRKVYYEKHVENKLFLWEGRSIGEKRNTIIWEGHSVMEKAIMRRKFFYVKRFLLGEGSILRSSLRKNRSFYEKDVLLEGSSLRTKISDKRRKLYYCSGNSTMKRKFDYGKSSFMRVGVPLREGSSIMEKELDS